MNRWRQYLLPGVLLVSGVAVGLFVLPRVEPLLPIDFAPVYSGAFVWDSAYAFLLGLAGVSLFLLIRMGLARSSAPRFVLYGLSIGMALFALSAASRGGDARIVWHQPAAGQSGDLVALDRAVQEQARAEGRPVFYYFRADWCDICPDFERNVLTRVAADAAPFLAVKMDVTDFERWHEYLETEYGVEATPTVVLRDRKGQLLNGTHFTGEHVSIRALKAALDTIGR